MGDGRPPAAGEAGKAVTQAGPLNRVIDGRPLRGACEGFKLRDLAERASLDQPLVAGLWWKAPLRQSKLWARRLGPCDDAMKSRRN